MPGKLSTAQLEVLAYYLAFAKQDASAYNLAPKGRHLSAEALRRRGLIEVNPNHKRPYPASYRITPKGVDELSEISL